jgi:Flp pilus assembly protein TadG
LAPDRRPDTGSASLQIVILTPVFLLIAMAAFQASIWIHQRTLARAVARDAVTMVAQGGQTATQSEQTALAMMHADRMLARPTVTIRFQPNGDQVRQPGSTTVVATITGTAPGILVGTGVDVTVTEVLPLEGWQP